MKVLLTVNYSPWSRYSGGGQRSTHNLALALAKRGHDVTVIFTKAPWESVALPPSLPYSVLWAALPGVRRGSPIFVARAARRWLASAPAGSIVHANGEESALIPRLRARLPRGRFAFVMTPRYPALPAALMRDVAQQSRARLALVALLQTKYAQLGAALRGASWVCPTSRSAAEMVQRAYGLSSDTLTVIPNGISDEFIRAGDPGARVTTLSASLKGLTGDGGFGVYFGRIAREKGVHLLIEALARAGAEPRRWVLVGRGPEVPALQMRVQQLGLGERVSFVPWLDAPELAALVRGASLAALPSLEESFGNSMAEAMALAVPVLSTTAGSIPELIAHGKNGWLVPPGDADALAEAIRRLAGDPELRRALGEAGRAHVIEHLTWDASAAAFERVYERALQRER
ncbi:MAG TPA: glycosyltransferase family 4 protein [Polyangiales bacterium]|nr:glycosyltransferase family 4 protein [Polyangiales bacterium]